MQSDYDVKYSEVDNDPEWDSFVEATPGGHHVQTSCWGRIKMSLNWRPSRIKIMDGTEIIGGAQILLRSVPLIGSVGYVTKGPLLSKKDPEMARFIIDQIIQVFRMNNCQLMAIQPPNNGEYISDFLEQSNFSRSTLELAPTASLVLDLEPGREAIIKELHHKTRQYLRQSERIGMKVTEGSYEDLDIFYDLHLCTARRQKFTPYKRDYFNLLWRNLAPSGWIKLFIAWNSEPLSAMLVIPFGDTVLCKLCGWNGTLSNTRPNEAMHWEAISWAIDHGFRYFDFEGIDPSLARYMLSGGKLSTSQHVFKIGFGGKPVLYPPAYDLLPNQLFNWFYRRIPPVMYGDSVVSQALEQFRKR